MPFAICADADKLRANFPHPFQENIIIKINNRLNAVSFSFGCSYNCTVLYFPTMIGWLIVSFFGFIDILLQFIMPDFIPELIEKATANSTYIGVSFLGNATFILYIFGGYILFIGGLIMAFRSYRQVH